MTAYISIFCLVAAFGYAACQEAVLGPNTWAVLVAGSTGWINYRHQADVCHAYHSLIKRGVVKENIITLMYDDIAYNPENLHKGKIFNRPNGTDVYNGVVIDYKGKTISANNFLNIIEGNEADMENIGSGKVLKSTENDTVFINFVDHGGTGMLSFPQTYLTANKLIATLNKMSKNNMFRKLILFIEACESGSIFDGYIDHLENVFVSTAAAADESSWAWYCEEEYGTCLGDLYSIKWMERLDKLNNSETLFDNYNAIRTAVNKSHVQLYGDYRLGFLKQFESDEVEEEYQTEYSESHEENNGVDSRDIPLYFARKGFEAAKETGNIILKKEKLEKIIQSRGFADILIKKILNEYTLGDIVSQKDLESSRLKLDLNIFSCYEDLLHAFDTNCFSIAKNTYFTKHLYKFANICVQEESSIKAVTAIQKVCSNEIETINNFDFNIE